LVVPLEQCVPPDEDKMNDEEIVALMNDGIQKENKVERDGPPTTPHPRMTYQYTTNESECTSIRIEWFQCFLNKSGDRTERERERERVRVSN